MVFVSVSVAFWGCNEIAGYQNPYKSMALFRRVELGLLLLMCSH